ncbi:MAG: lycopene cyclase domain-containing protein [Candidatus Kapabacteria bacterium]|nr:lycopene cyclase domain-containing protein [Candidatus Kapabacteria bacterium]
MTTYRAFHVRWTIPLLLACCALWTASPSPLTALVPLLGLCLIVVVFTFPWDNWAVARGIWNFPDDRLLFRIRNLPIEEVLFFVIQTLQVGLLVSALASWFPSPHDRQVEFDEPILIEIIGFLVLWVVAGVSTRRVRKIRLRITYAWHLLYWFLPVVIVQWIFGWVVLGPHIYIITLSAFLIGTILTASDVWAVRRGIWFFDERQITGPKLATILPWEEIAFFYITSIVVAQSMVLFLPINAR